MTVEIGDHDEPYICIEQMAAHLFVRVMVAGLEEGNLDLRTWEIARTK